MRKSAIKYRKKQCVKTINAFNAPCPAPDLYVILYCMQLLSDEHVARQRPNSAWPSEGKF